MGPKKISDNFNQKENWLLTIDMKKELIARYESGAHMFCMAKSTLI